MPAIMQKSALALVALSVSDGARSAPKQKQDGYQLYEGKPLLELSPCKAWEVEALSASMEKHQCRVLEDEVELPPDGGCAQVAAVCETSAAYKVKEEFPGVATIVSSDAASYYRRTSGTATTYVSVAGAGLSDAWYSAWRGFNDRMARVEQIVAGSGGYAKIEVAGQSHEGRDIKLVRFRGSNYVSGGPKVVLSFNLHAREWIAGMAGIYTLEKFTEMVKNSPRTYQNMEVVMVPMANPDGFAVTETADRYHRKNTNGIESCGWFCKCGVDLNRNFDTAWGTVGSSSNRCSDVYHGPRAASEKETQTMVSVMSETPMTVFIDCHAYTNLILWSWGHTRQNHPRQREFAELGNQMKVAVERRHGQVFVAGAIAQTLYAAAGGIEDYGTRLGALGYTYELRPRRNQGLNGFAPPPNQILPASEEFFEGVKVAIEYARTK